MSEIPQATAHFVDTSGPSHFAPPAPPPPTYQRDFSAATDFLTRQNWPLGLQKAFIASCAKFPIRFMIVDDSGSMMTNDGHYLLDTKAGKKSVTCSRWKELSESMKFHANLAHLSDSCTEFRLLNGAQPIIIGNTPGIDKTLPSPALDMFNAVLDGSPGGGTPLCSHIRAVIAQITEMAPQLRANGHRAVVSISTDGESSDGDIAAAMKPLQSLPVWVVIRLCTDDESIVNYWNNIDAQLELEMDVLDDLFGEAEEVNSFNNWLTYGEPLHRLREGGVHIKEMDLIDEAKLSYDEMRHVCALVLDIGPPSELPHPQHDWDAFFSLIRAGNAKERRCWDPRSKVPQHWIREGKLRSSYKGGCTIM
mmetsp:Transcript_2295/g.4115  ORF Transcript_2295/g.4115 Transcript_2295/m.4115 type:complete len:364 (-) Transcript_2295:250-1341(-)